MASAPWLAEGQTAGRWVDAGELSIGDDIRRADGSTGDVESVEVVVAQQWMYNLTVAEAHTFFVGRQGWLVHNAGPCSAIIDGVATSASKLGTELASEADNLYRSIGRELRGSTTIAVTKVNGQFNIALNSGAPADAVSRIQGIANARGYNFIYDPTLTGVDGHAERVLHNALNGSIDSIGISHRRGACPTCVDYFDGTGVELSYTGITK